MVSPLSNAIATAQNQLLAVKRRKSALRRGDSRISINRNDFHTVFVPITYYLMSRNRHEIFRLAALTLYLSSYRPSIVAAKPTPTRAVKVTLLRESIPAAPLSLSPSDDSSDSPPLSLASSMFLPSPSPPWWCSSWSSPSELVSLLWDLIGIT